VALLSNLFTEEKREEDGFEEQHGGAKGVFGATFPCGGYY